MTDPWEVQERHEMQAEREDAIMAENAKLRERVAELEELLPENGRWFSFETVEAYVAENRKMRADLKDMAGLLIEFARGHDEIGDRLNVGDRTMPAVVAYLSELGIEVDE